MLAFCLLTPSPVAAQSAAAGDLQGTIVDATNSPIQGVRVSATNEEMGLVRLGTTNELGHYRIPELPAGEYKVRIVKPDFTTTERSGIVLRVGGIVTIDAQLTVATVKQLVTISAPARWWNPARLRWAAWWIRTRSPTCRSTDETFWITHAPLPV